VALYPPWDIGKINALIIDSISVEEDVNKIMKALEE
jgi:hypothetical protein